MEKFVFYPPHNGSLQALQATPPTVDRILPLCTDSDTHAHQQPTHFAEEKTWYSAISVGLYVRTYWLK